MNTRYKYQFNNKTFLDVAELAQTLQTTEDAIRKATTRSKDKELPVFIIKVAKQSVKVINKVKTNNLI